ncbi:MAG: hypothetical protein K0R54_3351 [Clostridiaceae bacterium]|jgi:oligosaccharide repeat unit polymerase|nr:hypothetical protein [Clostridiaceae bacterium]
MVNSSKNYEKKYLFLINIIVMIFLFILLYYSLQNNKLTIGLEISIFLILILVYINILFNISKTIFIDIRVSLILGYTLYNLYTPIIYCFRASEILNYGNNEIGWIFYSGDVQKALLISILFLIGLLIALTFGKNSENNVTPYDYKHLAVNKKSKINFYFWLILFIISFVWYLYPYFKVGFDFINYDRYYRYSFLFKNIKESLGTINKIMDLLFANYLIILSLFMMFKNAINNRSKFKRAVFAAAILIYSIFILFIDLRRRELLIVILMCTCYYFFHIKYSFNIIKVKKAIKKISVSLAILLIFFMAFQYYRQYLSDFYTGGISAVLDLKSKETDNESQIYYNEFGMVYLTNLSSAQYTSELFYGKSYFEALIRPIPIITKVTYEWMGYDEQRELPSSWLSTIYTDMFAAGGGLGFSPASEAFLNFGYPGCVIMGFIIGCLFNLLYKKLYNDRNIVIYCTLFSLAFSFSRNDFYGFTYEVFWIVFYYIFYSIIINVFRHS